MLKDSQKTLKKALKGLKNNLGYFLIPEKSNKYLPGALRERYLFWYGAFALGVKIVVISVILILPQTDFFSAITSQRLLTLINTAREEKGLAPVSLNNKLIQAAEYKANDMAANNYFEHTSPSGITPWHWFKQAGYSFTVAGENLAINFFDTDAVFNAWMNSPSHRANILEPSFREIGVAVKTATINKSESPLAVLVFATPKASSKTVTKKVIAPQSSPAATTPAMITQNPAITLAPSQNPSQNPNPFAPDSLNQISNSQVAAAPQQSPDKISNPSPSPSAQTSNDDNELQNKPNEAEVVLGVFISKSSEIARTLYIYFTLILTLMLLINIFVKIEVQYWKTIAATAATIILSGIMILI